MKLNDAQIAKDILTSEKNLAKLYMNGILESDCPKMRSTLTTVHNDIAKDQYAAFKYMHENNLYPVDYADNQKLSETITKYSSL